MKATLCREAVAALRRGEPRAVAERAIAELAALTGGQAGVVVIDRRGRLGYAHNAEVMDVAMFDATGGFEYRWAAPLKRRSHGAPATRRLAALWPMAIEVRPHPWEHNERWRSRWLRRRWCSASGSARRSRRTRKRSPHSGSRLSSSADSG